MKSKFSVVIVALSFLSALALVGISVSLAHCFWRSAQSQGSGDWDMEYNFSRLMAVSQAGNINSVREEIHSGASLNLRDSMAGDTALHLASFQGHNNVVRVLIASGADINILDNDGISPLIAATENGNQDVVLTLLKAGADTRTIDNQGNTALMRAQHNARLATGGSEALRYQNIAVLLKEYAMKQNQARNASPAPKAIAVFAPPRPTH